MTRQDLYKFLVDSFGFVPTEGQRTVLYHLAAFLLSEKPNPAYLLQGYAGTGKTTLVTTLVRVLPQIGMRYQLMAPTGRAAKVLSGYTGKTASTIHRKLYRFQQYADGSFRMTRAENKANNTVFIVDECSMISDDYSNGRSLLDDLINFVFSGENCRLLLIGDNAQLPPVGLENSPANDINVLRNGFNLTVASFELTEVMRQEEESGILWNATELRRHFDRPLGEEKSPTHFAGDFSIPLRSTRNDERSCYLMNCVIKITVIASGARNFMIKYMIFLNPILAVPPLVNSS